MRVAYVSADPGVPVFGRKGASVHVREVVRALRRRGATVELFAARHGGEAPADLADVRVHRLPSPGRGPAAERERRAQRAAETLPRLLAAAGPFDLLYERYSLWSTAALDWAAGAGVPSLLEVNSPLVEEQARHRALVDRVGAERRAREAFASAGAVLTVSEPVAAWVRATRPTAAIAVVPNGVDVERFAVPRRPSAGPVTVGFVGTLKPWHGVEHLVEAVGRLAAAGRPLRLLLVGDGPQRPALEDAVAAAGIASDTSWTGAVEPDRVPALLAGVDIAAAPYPASADRYFSPLKVLEYLAAGVPVVASRIGQVPALLEGGRAGVLVPPGDSAALAAALDALAGDTQRRAELAAAGRRAAAGRSWDAVVAQALAAAARGVPASAAGRVA